MATLRLQILLRKPYRNPEGVEKTRAALKSLGMEPTTSGAASLAATVDEKTAESVFGSSPQSGEVLPISSSLAEYVESISVAPRHIYMEG